MRERIAPEFLRGYDVSPSLQKLVEDVWMIYSNVEKVGFNNKGWNKISVGKECEELCRLLFSRVDKFMVPEWNDVDLHKIKKSKSNDVVLMFSGGVSSIAMTLMISRLKKYNPHLLFLKNTGGRAVKYVNDNYDAVMKLADELNLPIDVISIKANYPNPVYKSVLVCCAILYAVENNYSHRIYMGGVNGLSDTDDMILMSQDTMEFRKITERLIRTVVPDFEICLPIPSLSFMWDELKFRRSILDLAFCDSNISKATFYINRVDQDLIGEKDSSLYIKYVKKIIKFEEKETGMRVNDIDRMWKKYFFYNIEKSKHKDELIRIGSPR